MFGTHDLPLFVISGLLLNMTPGADTLLIVSRSASLGVRAGVAAALGVCAGCSVHVLAAALGLSALLATSATAFTLLKWLGAAYLVVLGLAMLLRRPATAAAPVAAAAVAGGGVPSWGAVFAQGFLSNALNPKVALFFLAFVPQFIEPAATHKAAAFVFLGGIFIANSTLWCLALAWAAARVGAIGAARRLGVWLARGVGLLFVLLGVRLALSEPH